MKIERKPGGFLSHTATYAIGNITRRVVGFAMLPIYTRFLSPADYGVIGLLTFALAIFEPLFGARLARAIPKFYFDALDGQSKREVIWSAVSVSAVVSAISMSVLIAFRVFGAEILFGDRKYAFALGVFAVNLLSRPLENAGMMYLRLKQHSRVFLAASLAKLILQIMLNVFLVVYLRRGVLGVVVSGVISSCIAGGALMTYTAVKEAPSFDWRIARRMVEYCWPLWLSGLAGLYIGSSGAIYLRAFDTLTNVGRLELGLRFATAVGLLVWSPFFQHWEPMSYQYYREKSSNWKFQVAFISSAALMFSVGLGVSIYSQPVIDLMAAKSFYPAAAVVPVLTVGFIMSSLTSFFDFSFLATGNTKIFSLCQYAMAVFITVAYMVLVPRFGLFGAAVAQCLAFSAGFAFIRNISRKYFDPGFTFWPIAVFAVIGAIAYVCSNLLIKMQSIGADLAVKSVFYLAAVGLIALIGARSVRAVNTSALDTLPWPLNRLERVRVR